MAFESTPNIALIEDDDIVRQATSQWLQLAGFNVEAFSTGDAWKGGDTKSRL